MESFINKEVAEILKMKQGTVAYYTNKGFIKPDIDDPRGRGTTRRYSRRNLVEFLLIPELQKHGMALPKVKETLNQAREKSTEEFNLRDGLNFDDPIIRNAEVFIIIYDDDENLSVKFRVLGRKKTDDELKQMSEKEIRKEIEQFLQFRIDMDTHDSAIVINVSKLWRAVVDV